MKTLLTVLFWVAAAGLALLLLLRVCRGKPLMISKSSSRVLSMAVFLLVLLGVGSERGIGQTEGTSVEDSRRRLLENTPQLLQSEAFVAGWRRMNAVEATSEFYRDLELLSAGSEAPQAADVLARVLGAVPFREPAQSVVRSILKAKFGAAEESVPLTAEAVLLSLDAVEAQAAIHPAQIRVFSFAAPLVAPTDPEGAVRLLTRLHAQARMHEALVAASFGVQPYQARAWMSKAGAPTEVRMAEVRAVGRILGALPYEYATRNAGLWDREARARVVLKSGEGLRVVAGGQSLPVAPGAEFEMARLSAWRTQQAAVVHHDWLGAIELPADRLIFAFQLPDLLKAEALARVAAVGGAALLGSEDAGGKLERSLPLTPPAMLAGCQANPQAKGAPALRLLLKHLR